MTSWSDEDAVVVDRTLSLYPLDLGTATAIATGDRAGRPWATDFPADGDAVVATMLVLSAAPVEPATRTWPFGSPWVVVRDGRAVGIVGFKGPPVDGEVEIGYGVVPSVRGRGVATSAVRSLLSLAPPGTSVVAETAPGNAASQGVLTRLGFSLVGHRGSPDDGRLLIWRRDADPG